jgi:phage tail protein X
MPRKTYTRLAAIVAAMAMAAPALAQGSQPAPVLSSPALALAPAISTGTHTVCAQSAWVRQSDLSHQIGILYKGNTMTIDRLVWKTNHDSEWAYGTAHTSAGNVVGYVEVAPSNPFC